MKKPRLALAQPRLPVRRRPSRGKPKEPKPGTAPACRNIEQAANVDSPPANDEAYWSFFGNGPTVIVKPQRWQRCIIFSSVFVACIATKQTGHTFGGFGRCSMPYSDTTCRLSNLI
jgi:hypothetical protein